LLSFASSDSAVVVDSMGIIDWSAWLSMWFVVGCFALAARWLEHAQRSFGNSCANPTDTTEGTKSVWMLHHREALLLWLWCLLQPVCFVASGWTQWTQRVTDWNGLQFISIFLSLVPSIVLLTLVELIRTLQTNRRGLENRSALHSLLRNRKDLTRRIVSTWFIPIALPIGIAGVMDVASRMHGVGPNPGLLGTISCTLTVSMLVTVLVPHLFTRLIGAEPVDDSVALIVRDVWQKGSDRVPRILLWPTGCRMANAAVVGLFSFGRKLLLTDALLQKLDDRELSMVVLHELAHCVRWHSWIRMTPTFVVVLFLFGSMTWLSGTLLSLVCVILFLLFIASLIGVCWWTEFDADRIAIEIAVRSSTSSDFMQARRDRGAELGAALRKIYGEQNRKRRSWMHPSCEQRLAAIRMRD
jgi:Zn-dependent protease with chaperone function